MKEIFKDHETDGLHAYEGNRSCGIAFTHDDEPTCWYIPIRHQNHANLPVDGVVNWLKWVNSHTEAKWINHSVKFDAHMENVDGAIEGTKHPELTDTLTLAKLLDSDRWMYGLDKLVFDWLGEPMEEYAKIKAYIKSQESPNYSFVPADLMGEYGCGDVHHNRRLYRFIQQHLPEDVNGVRDTEVALTQVLFDAEREGLRVDERELKVERFKTLRDLVSIGYELKELTGQELNPKSSTDVYDVLITQLGLPVLAFTKTTIDEDTGEIKGGNPSFDKKAIAMYRNHPAVMGNDKTLKIVELIHDFRKAAQYLGLYVEAYLDHQRDGVLHPFYNQCVRTGRMSGSHPNPQQLNAAAKALIHPRPGWAFLAYDYSQIEYRLIAHYIEDENVIRRYLEDPDVDFHQMIADMIGVSRKAGKTLNFGMGYGMGKAKLTAALAVAPEIVEAVSLEIDAEIAAGHLHEMMRNQEFSIRCEKRAAEVYSRYHEQLPNLKRTSYEAQRAAKRYGYVFNAYGRRRQLPPKFAHKGFNSVIQSCAADVMKERTVALAPRNNKFMRDHNIHIVASVHDETLFTGPIEVMRDPAVRRYIRDELENTRVKFSIPIRTDCGYSERSWAEASSDEGALEISRA